MIDLDEIIRKEMSKNNTLKHALQDGSFPSKEVAKEIGSEKLYEIAANSIEFNFKTGIEILQSSYHLVELMKLYAVECESFERTPKIDVERLKTMIGEYDSENQAMINGLIRQISRGYEASW